MSSDLDKNQIMKNFNITTKFFREINAFFWCDICQEILSVSIGRKTIKEGLDTGLFINSFYHTNPLYDPEDPEDHSNNPHTSLIYIDRNHDVRGVRSFYGTEMSSDEMKKGSRIPIVIKEISKMVLQLGMVTQDEFNILKLCDGNNSIETIAEIENKAEIENIILKLKKKKLINIITRG